jgi:hypothetical protein
MRRVSSVRERTPSLWHTRERLASTIFGDEERVRHFPVGSALGHQVGDSPFVGLRLADGAARTPVRLSPA